VPNNPENDCDLDGCTVAQGDCADSTTLNPLAASIRGPSCPNGAAAETCDGADNNCSGAPDEGNPGGGGACGTGLMGVCSAGTRACQGGMLACVQNVMSSAETCNNLDDDCDGMTDDNVAPLRCFTGDAGTFTGTCPGAACTPRGQCRAGTAACVSGTFGACTGQTLPVAEVCDGLDNDCNGEVDDHDGDDDGLTACEDCDDSDPFT
jgi:hypothetical protein